MFPNAKRCISVSNYIGLSFLAGSILAFSGAGASAADGDGCWSGYHSDGGSCVALESEYDGSRQHLTLSNRCSERLYLTWCGQDQCGTDALRPRQSKSRYLYSSGNTAKVYAVGSNNPSKDDICNDRIGRW